MSIDAVARARRHNIRGSMYAVIETGGKQYRVEVGTELQVELLDVEPGKTITLDRVLLVADGDTSSIGRPLVADAAVSAEVVRQIRGEKLISFKYRPKARSRVKKGHRQELTVLRISDITLDGKSAARSARKAEEDAKTERQRLEEAATAQAGRDAELAAKLAVGSESGPRAPTKAKAKHGATGKIETSAIAETPAKGQAATTATTPKATAKPAAKAKPVAKARAASAVQAKPDEAPKRARAKASTTDDAAKADSPKRTRTTKKDT
jgi:large subunit ribosomal protein L21